MAPRKAAAITRRSSASPASVGRASIARKAKLPSKKAKPSDGKGKQEEEKEKQNDEITLPEPKKLKTGKKRVKEGVVEDEGSLPTPSNQITRTIIIEACTQCRSFKERADKVKRGLESAIPSISVEINPQKPRRGYFEIREEKTEVFLSLPSMKRPFTSMKQLNMDELVEDLIKRCK